MHAPVRLTCPTSSSRASRSRSVTVRGCCSSRGASGPSATRACSCRALPPSLFAVNDTMDPARRARRAAAAVELLLVRRPSERGAESAGRMARGLVAARGAAHRRRARGGLGRRAQDTIRSGAPSASRRSRRYRAGRELPLPPYRGVSARGRRALSDDLRDPRGAVAALTAGLHLSARLLDGLAGWTPVARVTLHVGPGIPLRSDDLADHIMRRALRRPERRAGDRAARGETAPSSPSARPSSARRVCRARDEHGGWHVPAGHGGHALPLSTRRDASSTHSSPTSICPRHAPRCHSVRRHRSVCRALPTRSPSATASSAMATRCSSDDVSHSRLRLRCHGARWRCAHRHVHDDARHHRDAGFHASRHASDGEVADARRGRGDRRAHDPRQHLSPLAAPHGRAGSALRRRAALHALAARDADGLGRLPGLLARRPAHDRRRRSHLQVAPRRREIAPHARGVDARAGAARLRRRDGARCVSAGRRERKVIEEAMRRTTARPRAASPRRPRRDRRASASCKAAHGPASRALDDIAALPFDGIALGNFSVGEPIPEMYRALSEIVPKLPQDKPAT